MAENEPGRLKEEGNELFKKGAYEEAKLKYEEALGECSEDEEKALRAVCYGNLATCLFKLERYEESVERAGKALELDEEYIKARMRRAMANEKLDTWAALEAALEDLCKVRDQLENSGDSKDDNLLKDTKSRIAALEPKIKTKQQQETQEMMGKLKDLGNGFLSNFGMSLDNFKLNQNPDGGYSINMQ
ncbi:hypothetical protein TRICI_001769 [Trichomonascus ciferrii]|uniref:Tetratricopeptide SHNi-TPR domain-containing protein n=1 Tax=Trichomonascus ciferrii TaxID=44093 RepID=A0A642V8F6_9ASCO|nr:hypothetical protein TRICI_001769 [Trichomonascus ciferrii]